MADNAQSRYEKKTIRRINLPFNRNTEPDLLAYIETIPNKTKYIKDLIREDMKRKGL
ncbi:MAG: hypothetical protein IJ113_03360 [Eggerthellaceae bacterium]|nr:hypothetical protein [Eggerthellaceae bacterium]MBQ9147793.1 hypothetical protein [Rikenellaceae bacterium]